ncbi:heme-dependent oxidative N-demethylase family protein [Polymorphum gilvum]|uniref:DUF3445 domain-containing protein n=1 Tax=Polymorphum gilvum (strain LMG 25793 / CGMCC 1.9160 / SL003B-26A1) TaxID=991905 RepID=F2IX14_POLGS|nr:heme-dependent oxidative N-demethylase subunit alpha family protein [Polymorphum gilvum]ADZ69306.1 hypothetical protein SL003B_0876 [Polymorphum gilvum SL003B-26A1]
MNVFRHTPYDGSKQPFSIGLEPVAPAAWFDPDGHLIAHLDQKARLLAERRDVVFRAEPETGAAQAEVLRMLVAHLSEAHPTRYRRAGDAVIVTGAQGATDRRVALDADEPPLLTASRLVQEDLVIMRKGEGGYRLAAASLCFPSSWSLAEKFGQPMAAIHTKVPGFAGRMGQVVDRIFDNLKPDQLVGRLNWSIYDDADLHHPEPKQLTPQIEADGASALAALFVRVERQTLRRLPDSGDVLFTIKIHHDPIRALEDHPRRAELAAGLLTQLLALDVDQLAYKGLTRHRDRIAAALQAFAAAPA